MSLRVRIGHGSGSGACLAANSAVLRRAWNAWAAALREEQAQREQDRQLRGRARVVAAGARTLLRARTRGAVRSAQHSRSTRLAT